MPKILTEIGPGKIIDQGHQCDEEQKLERNVAALKRRITKLGFVLTPVNA